MAFAVFNIVLFFFFSCWFQQSYIVILNFVNSSANHPLLCKDRPLQTAE